MRLNLFIPARGACQNTPLPPLGLIPLPPKPFKTALGGGVQALWWVPSPRREGLATLTETSVANVLKGSRLVLSLSRRGRQLVAEVSANIETANTAVTSPITTFTASWVAQLLGYARRYRGSRIVETFTALAVRSYLLLYPFVRLDLVIKGPLSNFSFIWRTLNSPAGQVFTHPLTGALIWDIKSEGLKTSDLSKARELLVLAFNDADCEGGIPPEEAVLDAEAHAIAGTSFARWKARYKLLWGFVFFAPSAFNKPRRAKKARSIRKRIAKRLVRAVGQRF